MTKRRKKILVFIDWFLPGYKAGGPVRSVANMVDHLRDEFDFFIVTRNMDYLSNVPYEDVRANEWVDLRTGVKVYYISADRLGVRSLRQLVDSMDFDLVHVNGIYSFYFSILPVWLARSRGKPVIISARGMLSAHAFSRKAVKKNLFLSLAKAVRFYRNVCFHATNAEEDREIKRFFPRAKVWVIPNAVRRIDDLHWQPRQKQAGRVRLVSIARISQEKNTLFALQVLSQIKKGEVEFDLYGTVYDKEYWQQCQSIINQMKENVKVRFLGPVHTEKVIETFSQYHFSFMPSQGENFGHSIFESLAAGTPVIISSNTPWRELESSGLGWDIDLGDMAEFVRVIDQCIRMDGQEYNRLSQNVFNFAQEYARQDKSVELYKQMFSEC